jgi:tricorn protease
MTLNRLVWCAFFLAGAAFGQPPLLQKPALSKTQIVFSYAGDLWVVAREGGEARKLTSAVGTETNPHFSPDGTQVAFTGEYDGNIDAFVVPASGGVPRRLTWHPGQDLVQGWTHDGKGVLIMSNRSNHSRGNKLFVARLEGGPEEEIPLPQAEEGSFSPDGSRIAYVPIQRAFTIWKRYRGGQTTPVWIANLADSKVEKVPRQNSNDFNPVWFGDRVYFLSDRSGPVSLFAYDTVKKTVTPVIKNDGLDLKWLAKGPDALVYEQFGAIFLVDPKTGKASKVDIKVTGDLTSVRPSIEKVAANINSWGLSPTGARVVFGARGEVFTAPAQKGDIRNLTETSGVAERAPKWSPDGRWIAYFSDESGEYMLNVREQSGFAPPKKISLGEPPTFYYNLFWSPDSKKIAYTDKRLNIWYVDLEKQKPVKVDSDTYDGPIKSMDPSWSPDSNWIAYTKLMKNNLRAAFVYSLETGKPAQVSDGMSDARYAVFDRSGDYLYFTASTNQGPASWWLDMSSVNRPVSRNVYVTVLAKDKPSPLAPESDEEKPAEPEKKPDAAKPDAAPKKTVIDLDGLSQRILAMPLPARNYVGLVAGKAGVLYAAEAVNVVDPNSFVPQTGSIVKFDWKTRKTEPVVADISAFEVSANGEKMLYRQGQGPTAGWFVAATSAPVRPGEGRLNLDTMEMRVNPREEWSQIYNEVWRIQRDFFYDPGLHGLNLAEAKKRYAPYLESVGSRGDLNYLFQEMLGEISVGHMFVGGGAQPQAKQVPGGLLGADYKLENGRYRIARVYTGENWNPQLRAPLTQPGVNVREGEYVLAVNGRELRASDNIHAFFEGTANKQVTLRVGPDAGGANARDVTVVPVANEFGLRNLAWIEGNRRKVEQLSGGKLGYLYLPNTGGGGYTNFNRYYFAQIDKQGLVVDERANSGGLAADYIIDYMRRPILNKWATREGEDFATPAGSVYGPKAMIIDEYSSSGGDAMPWYFRKMKIGPLVGKRTWGGLVGNIGAAPLIDGGFVSSPNVAFYNLEGSWDVENAGVPPDIEVEQDPFLWRQGRDPQLEKAVEAVLAELKKNPPPVFKKPAYPNYHVTK